MDLLPAISADAARLAAAARTGFDLEVPTCPGWTVGRLIGHTARVHQWVDAVVSQRSPDGAIDAPLTEAPRGPEVIEWFEAGVDRLLTTLAGIQPDDRFFFFLTGPDSPGSHWVRRMAVETAIHRWDAERAIGRGAPIEVPVAEAGLTEFFDLLFGRSARGEGLPGSLHLHRTDGQGEWVVRLGAAGGTVTKVHDKADCALRGTASDLLLWLWNRVATVDLDVHGKAEVAEAWKDVVRV